MGSHPFVYVAVLACVVMISAGQLLFKVVAGRLGEGGIGTIGLLTLALAIYGTATIAWIFVLRYVHLSSVYPLMALSFVLVPLGSRTILGEPITPQYWVGVALLVGGILVIVGSIREG
jgi:drug/metabolite transporter (DMT)-like permease